MAARAHYILTLTAGDTGRAYKLRLPRRAPQLGLALALILLSLFTFSLAHYAFALDAARHYDEVVKERLRLKTSLRVLREELVRIDTTLKRIDTFSARLRTITELHDPDRNLGLLPTAYDEKARPPEVLYAPDERRDAEDEAIDSRLATRLLDDNLARLAGDALRSEERVGALHDHFVGREVMLSAIPSIRPVASRLVTARFELRHDPFTDHEVMHKGLDFAAEPGAPVRAPAAGTIVFVGVRGGGFGLSLVVDHGYGMQTHYAHLEEACVTLGTKVDRGEMIATVGNTGRSIAAHLHYEVRFEGIPQDPERYLFD